MKKLLLLLLCVPLIGFGQEKNHQIGIVIGESLNTHENSPLPNVYPTITTISGLGIKYYVSDKFSINSKILYHPKGYKINNSDFSSKLKVNHVSLPILLQYHFGKKNNYVINAGWFTSIQGKRGAKGDNESFVWSDFGQGEIEGGIVLGLSYIYPINYKINLNFEVESHNVLYTGKNRLTSSMDSYIVQIGLNYNFTR